MKKLSAAVSVAVALSVLATACLAQGSDTIESLQLCKSKDTMYLVTVSDSETEGRAIWVDDYELLIGDYPTILIPIHDKKSFKNIKEINTFMKKHFGTSSCTKTDVETVQTEIDKQAEAYNAMFK